LHSPSLEHKSLKIISSLVETHSRYHQTSFGSPAAKQICLQRVCGTNTVHFCQDYMVIPLQNNYKLTVKRNVNIREEFLKCVGTINKQQPDDTRQLDLVSKLEKKTLI
jgi:hypothetical protein